MRKLLNISKALTLILSITLVSGCDDVGGSGGSGSPPVIKSGAGMPALNSGINAKAASGDNTNTFYILNRTAKPFSVVTSGLIHIGVSPSPGTKIRIAPNQTVIIEGWDAPLAAINDIAFTITNESASVDKAELYWMRTSTTDNHFIDFMDHFESSPVYRFDIMATTTNLANLQEDFYCPVASSSEAFCFSNNIGIVNDAKHSVSYIYILPPQQDLGFSWKSYDQLPVVTGYYNSASKYGVTGTFTSDAKSENESNPVKYTCRIVNESGVPTQDECITLIKGSSGNFSANVSSLQGMSIEIQAYLQSIPHPTESNSMITRQVPFRPNDIYFKDGGHVKVYMNSGTFNPSDAVYTNSNPRFFTCAVTDKNGVVINNSKNPTCEISNLDDSDGTRSFTFANDIAGAYIKVSACEKAPDGVKCVDAPVVPIILPLFDVVQYTNSESLSYVKSNIPVYTNVPVSIYSCTIDGSPTSICSPKADESGNLVFSFSTEPTITPKTLVLSSTTFTMPIAKFALPIWSGHLGGYYGNDGSTLKIVSEKYMGPFNCSAQDSNNRPVAVSCWNQPGDDYVEIMMNGTKKGVGQKAIISRTLKNLDTGEPYDQTLAAFPLP